VTRIIAGEFGGRRLAVPADARVRPTADRVREAWMSILGGRLTGARVLDLFAGSGAIGLEALSRGIRANVDALGVADRVTLRRGDAIRFVERIAPDMYDLALADPPFTVPFAERLIQAFRAKPFAKMLAVEHSSRLMLPGDDTRRYGDIALTFCHAP
jgi:16S rRNA (guanine966-N2)-methyltransferase